MKNKIGIIKNVKELGSIMRRVRKNQKLTLEKVAGVSDLSMRFLSELERGKETAELGKAIHALNMLGLEVIIQPRNQVAFLQQQLQRLDQESGND